MAFEVFSNLVILLIVLALVFQFVPLIINACLRRSEEVRIEKILTEKVAEIKPEDLTMAFKSIKESTSPTPVTRTTLAVLPIIIVGIAIFYLIVNNHDILLIAATNNTTSSANSTISTVVTQSNSLINTLLGVLAGFLTSIAGFYFGAKAAAAPSSPSSGADNVSGQLEKISKLHDEGKLTDADWENLKKKLI